MPDIIVEQDGPVLLLRLNRPDRLNAFSEPMLKGMTEALNEARHDKGIRVVVLSGEGRVFSAGGDVKNMSESTPDLVYEHIDVLIETVLAMTSLEKPIITAVQGVAAGAGFNLALASDLVFASEDARFMMSFVHVGLISDGGGLWFLPRAIGPHRAKELFFLGDSISADTALEWGIVNRVLPLATLQQDSLDWAHRLAQRPQWVLAQTKRLMSHAFETSLPDMLRQEQITQAVLAATHDHQEGVRAFLEKRPPQFSD